MVSNAYKAMAHPARRQILALLRKGAMTSGELAEQFEAAWPTITRHLKVLHEAELITAERQGTTILYRINASVVQDVAASVMDLLGVNALGVPTEEEQT